MSLSIEKIEKQFRNAVREAFKGTLLDRHTIESLTPETKIAEIGINSLIFIKIIVQLEKEFGIEFDELELDFNNFKTVRDILNYIGQKL